MIILLRLIAQMTRQGGDDGDGETSNELLEIWSRDYYLLSFSAAAFNSTLSASHVYRATFV